jgi:ribosomal protein S21
MPSGNRTRGDVVAVEVREGPVEFEKALKRFTALWKNSGLVRELKRRRDFPSMADRRREKAQRAERRRMRGPH